jgi:3-oxoadipate enol-lactonase
MGTPAVLGYRTFPTLGKGDTLSAPVVLVRGLGRSSGFWLDFIEHLTPWATVVAVDLLGTGKSPDPKGRCTIEDMAEDLIETLEKNGLFPCHLVGISLGGMVCLEAAARSKSEKVLSLNVWASSARFTKMPRIRPQALLKMLAALRTSPPDNRRFASDLVASETLKHQPDLPLVWNRVWQEEGFVLKAVLRQLFAAALFHGKSSLEKVKCPCYFVASKADGLVDWRNTQILWEAKKGAKLHLFENYGHDFPTDAPKETAELLCRFLRELPQENEI